MRVYFNLADSAQSLPDQQGVDVVDVEEARTEAKRAIAEMLQQDPAMKANVGGWRLDAVDATGAVLFSINLDRVVD
jgi:hypothetical protein